MNEDRRRKSKSQMRIVTKLDVITCYIKIMYMCADVRGILMQPETKGKTTSNNATKIPTPQIDNYHILE